MVKNLNFQFLCRVYAIAYLLCTFSYASIYERLQAWWRHQMEAFFCITGLLCGEFTGRRWIPFTLWWFFDVGSHELVYKQSNDRRF